MKAVCHVIFLALMGSTIGFSFAGSPAKKPLIYQGTSDASAAVTTGEDMFIVADDENNTLRVYKTEIGYHVGYPTVAGGLPICSYDLTDFLDVKSQHPEADIEGATMIADRIYWITSHGRDKDGQIRPNRYRFFATTIKVQNGNVTITPIGKPCKTLVHKMLKTETLRHLGLDKATRFNEILTKKERKKLAPKEKGLNIEALCASADGRTLYIGFRNPLPINLVRRSFSEGGSDTHRPNALVVPLKNAAEVIEKQDEPIFGEPILWDLKGLGIRSMEYSPFHKAYFIIAGPYDEEPKFALYRWSADIDTQPVLVRQLSFEISNFTPEALIPFKNSSNLLLLSDDGSLVIKVTGPHECMEGQFNEDGTCPNKFLLEANKKTFRAIRLIP